MQQAERFLGSVALSANGTTPQPLTAIEEGPVEYFIINWFFSLKSTGSAFATQIATGLNAAAPGADDADLLIAALFNLLTFYVNDGTLQFQLAPQILRRVLAFLNWRDFAGSFMASSTIPASTGSARAYSLSMVIPSSLQSLFADGQIFQYGSEFCRTGYFQYGMGSSLTPTITFTNGTASLTALSQALRVKYGVGTAGDVPHTWQAAVQNNLSNVWRLEGGQARIGLFDFLSPANNTGVGITVEDKSNNDPTTFATDFAMERLQLGGYDVSQSYTPYIWPKPGMTFSEWANKTTKVPRIEITIGVSVLNLLDIRAAAPAPETVQRVAKQIGGSQNAETQSAPVLARSMAPGEAIPAGVAAHLPLRIMAGAAPSGSPAKTNRGAEEAASRQASLASVAAQARSRVRAARGK